MFPSFTGSSRRPRQVNLSNRSTNPFAAHPSKRQPPSGQGPQATIALAQQERLQRQHERDRVRATYIFQRVWKGYRSRKATRATWRNEWDAFERERLAAGGGPQYQIGDGGGSVEAIQYATSSECILQLRKLLHFVEKNNQEDAARLGYFAKCLQQTVESIPSLSAEGGWSTLLLRLTILSLDVLSTSHLIALPTFSIDDLLRLLIFLTKLIPKQMARQASKYYSVMAMLTTDLTKRTNNSSLTRATLVEAVVALLQPITSETLEAYEWFARGYLTIPSLQSYLGSIDDLASYVNYKLLASVLDVQALQSPSFLQRDQSEGRIWLLAYFIFFHRHALGAKALSHAPEVLFVRVVSSILRSSATEIAQRLDIEESIDPGSPGEFQPFPAFVRNQILTLVDQSSITHLLSRAGAERDSIPTADGKPWRAEDDAKSLATYALTLLRIFSKRGDEIRMWLYLGSAATSENGLSTTDRLPALKYFWHASKATKVYRNVIDKPDGVLAMLRHPPNNGQDNTGDASHLEWQDREQEWTIILLFLELYTFLLKVLDDDEFFSGGKSSATAARTSWTKESTLPLREVQDLTVFLKNLAFTLYWNSADLTAVEIADRSIGMRDYFNPSTSSREPSAKYDTLKPKTKDLGGVTGIPLPYFKGLVTGLLRMIHERDSRRRFLPEGHWLMTGRFDMAGFIPTVVAEEENRHQLQDEDEDTEPEDDMMDDDHDRCLGLVGTSRAQQLRRIELLKRRQHQVARQKELEAVAPRLEILRNMPFFIPFNTRVQIFREFIYRDQVRRRKGNIDPDAWRLSLAREAMGISEDGQPLGREMLSKHHADIRRNNLFEDAFSQFYPLGEALKEPIQISFIDQFDNPEAGIDGGGVMKEFLTSIIGDAFNPSGVLSLFSENDEHLLYPNPTAVEQRRELLRQAGVVERSTEWNDQIRELLKRYEFLGRIIGKCLYEGILVDVNFAGFFLLKWALTGGSSSATKESAYRANLNDIQDLDNSLYQGLLQLKNYTDDVEDFALNFTVNDTISIPEDEPNKARTKVITRELKPGGSNIAVTNQNRLVYISYIARHRLQAQPYLQTNAFLQGLGQIIQPSWLSMFNQGELQRLVGGDSGEVDVTDLRRNTIYSGVYVIGDDGQEHPTIKLFWQVLHDMSNTERQKVLKFVTSTPRAPLLGFSHLNPRFSIRDSSFDEERLPSTSTCANLLKLPRYTSAEALREKLIYSINAGAGFDLS